MLLQMSLKLTHQPKNCEIDYSTLVLIITLYTTKLSTEPNCVFLKTKC